MRSTLQQSRRMAPGVLSRSKASAASAALAAEAAPEGAVHCSWAAAAATATAEAPGFGACDTFARRHNGPTQREREHMLKLIGCKSMEQLVAQTIPADIRLKQPLDLPVRRELLCLLVAAAGGGGGGGGGAAGVAAAGSAPAPAPAPA